MTIWSPLPSVDTTCSMTQVRTRKNIEAILPLSSQQSAMYFRCARTRRNNDDVGFIPVQFDLVGDLDLEDWRRAWERAIVSHQSLRASVHTGKAKRPHIVVWKRIQWQHHYSDLSQLSTAQQQSRISNERKEQRLAGLRLDQAPTFNVSTYRVSESRHRVCWNHHHFFLDGLSARIVLDDLLRSLECKSTSNSIIRVSLRDYVRQVESLDTKASESYWKNELANCERHIPAHTSRKHNCEANVSIEEDDVTRVVASLAKLKCPPNALIQAACSKLTASLINCEVAVFGISVSGRPPSIAGSDSVAGFFSQVVPVRVDTKLEQTIEDWLVHLRNKQFEAQSHQWLSLDRILEVSGQSESLFDSVLMIQKPYNGTTSDSGIELTNYSSGLTSGYALTANVTTGQSWNIRLVSTSERYDNQLLNWLANTLKSLILDLCSNTKKLTSDAMIVAPDGINQQFPSLHGNRNAILSFRQSHQQTKPLNPTEVALVQIWQSILGRTNIGTNENFFELGGKSLGAVRMMGLIQQRLGASLQPSVLLRHATIQKLANVIDADTPSNNFMNLVPIHVGTNQRNLFCVHGGDGHVLFYRKFALELERTCSTFGLQPFGLDGIRSPLESIEQMASAYVSEITRLQDKGPYHLLGHCSGGAIVFEMAKQLIQVNKTVGLLAIIDGSAPSARKRNTAGDQSKRNIDWSYQLRKFRRACRFQVARATNNINWQQELLVKWVWNATGKAFKDYSTAPLDHPALLVIGSDAAELDVVPADWRSVAANLEVVAMDCQHTEFFETPAVEKLAKCAGMRLDCGVACGNALKPRLIAA